MATCVHPSAASQSASASNSPVMALNVRVSLFGWPRGPGVSKHATTALLCTSSPQHRSCRTSIWFLLSLRRGGRTPLGKDCLACSPFLGRAATIEGACRCPDQSVARARGTKASRPLLLPTRLPPSIRASGAIFIVQGVHNRGHEHLLLVA